MPTASLSPVLSAEPATLVVTASPASGKEQEWEQALSDLIRTALTFPGHLGANVLKPRSARENQYRIISKFDSVENLERWRTSEERAEKVARLKALEGKPPEFHHLTGMETWFELPNSEHLSPVNPPKSKMAVIIWLAVYLTVLPLISVLKPWVSFLPTLLSSALLALVSVAIMTWIVMPMLTWIFRGWLFRS